MFELLGEFLGSVVVELVVLFALPVAFAALAAVLCLMALAQFGLLQGGLVWVVIPKPANSDSLGIHRVRIL